MSDIVSTAKRMGMDQVHATMVVPLMWVTPASSDPYSPVVITIVHTLQGYLRRHGFPNRGDGFVDSATSSALAQLAGPEWKFKTWIQIYKDVLVGHKQGVRDMGYCGGMGALTDAQWCSSKNPVCPNPLRGVVKPMTTSIATLFKKMQHQANRCAHVYKVSKVAADGRIGSGTLSLVNKCVSWGVSDIPLLGNVLGTLSFPSVEALAENADTATRYLEQLANSLGAPAQVSEPVAKHPSTGDPNTDPSNRDAMADADFWDRVKNFDMTTMLFLGGATVGGLLLYQRQTGKTPSVVKKIKKLLK